MKIAIIGAGPVGTGIGFLLQKKGHQIVGVASRTFRSAHRASVFLETKAYKDKISLAKEADVVLITTSDHAICSVAEEVAEGGGFRQGQTVMHMSGSMSSEVLFPAKETGARTVSIHPLQSCASVERAIENIPGSIFSIEGDEDAYPVAKQLVTDMGGEYFFITAEAKPLYHAAACVASNYLVSLVDLSWRLMEKAGMPRNMAAQALLPLMEGTIKNIQRMGIPQALTGPISRGDVETVEEHLDAMSKQAPDLVPLYSYLGKHTLLLAEAKGNISNDQVTAFDQLLALASEPLPGDVQRRNEHADLFYHREHQRVLAGAKEAR